LSSLAGAAGACPSSVALAPYNARASVNMAMIAASINIMLFFIF